MNRTRRINGFALRSTRYAKVESVLREDGTVSSGVSIKSWLCLLGIHIGLQTRNTLVTRQKRAVVAEIYSYLRGLKQ